MPFEFTCEHCTRRFSSPSRRPRVFCSLACRKASGRLIRGGSLPHPPREGIFRNDGTVLVPLTRGYFAIIDAIDAERILRYCWSEANGYAIRKRRKADGPGNKRIHMHRVILDVPDDVQVDHRDRYRLNNRRSNLRPASPVQNRANVGLRRNNTSGYRGVGRVRNGWYARIGRNHLGCFATAEEAARVVDAKAVELYGEYAFVNFPAE